MTVYERDLLGVGEKHEMDLGDGSRLVIVTHNSGKREVLRRANADGDSEKLFELTDKLARQVGTLLEDAYFQPAQMEIIETLLDDNTLIEWVEIDVSLDIVGKTLGESDLRQAIGASVIAIERGDEVVTSPGGDAMVEAGDMLVTIGPKTACRGFVALIKGV